MAPATFRWFNVLPLAFCLAVAGCAHLFGGGQRPAKEVQAGALINPPQPAPALFIPGPSVAAKPSALAQETGATILPPLTLAIAKKPLEEEPIKDQPSPLRRLLDEAVKRHELLPSYAVRLRRRESVGGHAKPEEILACKFRQEPYSVYFKWLGPEAKGREVVYVQGQHKNLIHSLTAAGDVWLIGGGKHFSIAPDHPMVRSKSRYPIHEAAVGAWIVKFGRLVHGLERNMPEAGKAKYLGEFKRTEFEDKVVGVLHHIPPGWETLLPRGGQRLWFFDPTHHLPVLIITHDDANREVEYYCLDQYRFNVAATDDDFDPDKLWKK